MTVAQCKSTAGGKAALSGRVYAHSQNRLVSANLFRGRLARVAVRRFYGSRTAHNHHGAVPQARHANSAATISSMPCCIFPAPGGAIFRAKYDGIEMHMYARRSNSHRNSCRIFLSRAPCLCAHSSSGDESRNTLLPGKFMLVVRAAHGGTCALNASANRHWYCSKCV